MATTTTPTVSRGEPRRLPAAWPAGFTFERSPWRLVTLSMLTLFLELALIRWTAANNVHLANIPNFVLLASFLGIGVGFLLARSSRNLFRLAPAALAVLVAFALIFPVKLVTLRGPNEFEGLSGHHPVSQWVSLPVIFALVVLIMAGLGQALARTFAQFEPLDAYRFDIIGSIGGIALFSALSFVGLPPIAWGAVVAVLFVLLLGLKERWWQWVMIAAVVLMLLGESLSSVDVWSPYYKITTSNITTTVDGHSYRGLSVSANNIPYQTLYSISTLRRIEPFYFFPYRHVTRSSLSDVLVIGAGTGNDVGVALSEGARHVDAVEIDPELVALGKQYNPEHAYRESARERLCRRRTGVPTGYEQALLADPLCAARLPDSAHGPVRTCRPRELLAHDPGHSSCEISPGPRRHLRHVQLLPAVPARPLCDDPRRCVRLASVCRGRKHPERTGAGGSHGRARRQHSGLLELLERRDGGAGLRRPSVPVPAGSFDPELLPLGPRPDPGGVPARGAGGGGAAQQDGSIPGPVLDGSSVPVARDQEHRPVRALVRNDLVRELARVRRRVAECLRGRSRRRGT